jgi:EAL domain-containing protein (putative c-di-GMP-specific phosphodiesterase class I)
VEGRELFLNASAGVAVRALPAPDVTPDDLLREADVALYAAKAAGKGQAVLYDPCMGRGAGERLELETDLRRALQRGELLLHFQPQMDLASGEVLAVEALLRWRHPRRGLVPPAEFIPLAEETGLILPIGRWVLEEACRQARAWQDLRPSAAPLVVGVNLSPRQFVQPDLVDQVRRALSAADLPAHCLELELTESAVMQDGATALAALQSLKALGVRLAIDDFGTGYSSLDYLRRFPVDTLKVDRTFVQELDHSRRTVAIVEAVTRLAHAVGMEVVAEGVETSSQLLHASAVHCDRGQGYYFARPLPAAELEAFLRSIGRRPAAHAS